MVSGKLSVAIATFNEEKNIARTLKSVQDLADEIIIVDGSSTDKTREIAKQHNAKVLIEKNAVNFNTNKQRAINACKNSWVLLLDADEVVSRALAKEIKQVLGSTQSEIEKKQQNLKKKNLFQKHIKILEKRDGMIGSQIGDYNAFFIPRLNYFLGRFLRYGGVYPDGVIRLIKKNKAKFPEKDVHEQIVVTGRVGWLESDLYHYADPSFTRYLKRWNRYTDLIAKEIKNEKSKIKLEKYIFIEPSKWFVTTLFRHKGILDGWQGIVFSFFSSLRFPVSYLKSLRIKKS